MNVLTNESAARSLINFDIVTPAELAAQAAASPVAIRDDGGKPDTSLIPPELLLRLLPEPMHPLVRWFHYADGQDPELGRALIAALQGAAAGDLGKGLINVAAIWDFGSKKYARHNWEKGLAFSRMYRSAINHALKSLTETNDEESGKPHLWHYACNVAMLWTMVERGRTDLDDRELQAGK